MKRRRRGGILRIVLALAVLLAVPTGARSQQGDDPAALLAAGESAYEAGDYELARERLWAYLERTRDVTGPSRLPQARALFTIALMEPDAAVARRHYETIVEEYAAATVAAESAFRLGVLELMEGRPSVARERFRDLDQTYPFSQIQPELPLWIGRTYLEEDRYVDATDSFLDGYTKVKSQDLPAELPLAQREALAAEYAWWLAKAFREEGDVRTARQYYSLLTLDYPGSPQAEEARAALEEIDGGELAERTTGRREPRPRPEAPEREIDRDDDEIARAEPERREEPPLVRTAPPVPLDEPEADEAPEGPVEIVREEPVEEAREEPVEEVARAPQEPIPGPEDADPGAEPDARQEVELETERDRVPEREPEEAEAEPADRRADVGPAALAQRPAGRILHLQVGAFTSASRAADLSKRLKADGFDANIYIAVVDGQGFYRVRIGPFRMPDEEDLVEGNRRRLADRGYPVDTVREER